MHEFFAAVYQDDMAPEDVLALDARAPSSSDPPIPSPDSITVTTEFGVVEEPANITTVSVAAPSPYHHAYDSHLEEENNVEMTEDLHEDLQTLQQNLEHMQLQAHTTMTPLLPLLHPTMEVPAGHNQDEDDVNDTGEEADIDTDDVDADAESAFIEEFIDEAQADGLLTPTMTPIA